MHIIKNIDQAKRMRARRRFLRRVANERKAR
nr:MAG TPA: hypothetical protein [Microviridae sp.]